MDISNSGKLPPQSTEIEQAVLGSVLLEKDVIITVMEMISPEYFYQDSNQKIFRACIDLHNNEKPIDILTVSEYLRQSNDLETVGGEHYISSLTNRVASSANIEFHCEVIRHKFVKREFIRISNEGLTMGYDQTMKDSKVTDWLSDQAVYLNEITQKKVMRDNVDLIRQVTKQIEQASQNKGLIGIPTGFTEIDELLLGYQSMDLIIKAARPSMGKTAHALCEAINMVVNEDKYVAFFSLEMSAEQLMLRIICLQTGISSDKLRSGTLESYDWKKYNEEITKLETSKLFICDDIYSLQGIKNKAKSLKVKGKLDIMFIDYLQLIEVYEKTESRRQQIEIISRQLKLLAKSLNIPVILLSQLSRAVESRSGSKIPMLSDLRDSGSLEQDADIVTFLYRPEYYGIDEDEQGNPTSGVTLFIVAKNRSGSLKDVEMTFVHNLMKFVNKIQDPF